MLAACHQDLDEVDGIFDTPAGPKVHCAVDLDGVADNSPESIAGALDRAVANNEIVNLYAHHPGETVALEVIENVISGAQQRGLHFVQYRDFANGTAQAPGIALSFDDTSIDAWLASMPLLAQYGAKVTYFVSRFRFITDAQVAELHQLADAGHDIEAHSVLHLRAPAYVEERGLDAYVTNEAQASIDDLTAAGFPIVAYAYPFGSRTDELDRALLERVKVLRSVAFPWTGGVESPCPR